MDAVLAAYQAGVAAGQIAPDAAQLRVVEALNALAGELNSREIARKSSALGWLFARKSAVNTPKGLYLWGSVGRGKTMLLDLFFANLRSERKRRVHFHAFMADVHARIFAWRQRAKAGEVKGDDPIAPVAAALADEARVLCFDEFAVTDIADAMILGRLFEALFARHVVVVVTSNVEPSRLYFNGLNRALFLPFIERLQAQMTVLKLDADKDYRLEKLQGASVYHVPNDRAAKAALDRLFADLTAGALAAPYPIDMGGRVFTVPLAAHGVARANFAQLCAAALGAGDYLALARAFHTLVLDDIPKLDLSSRNETKRFITLIDILYDYRVKLIASAEVEAQALYFAPIGHEAFEFDRTVSRLIEMRSESYWGLPHGRAEGVDALPDGVVAG